MFKNILDTFYPSNYSEIIITETFYIKSYYNIDNKYIFVPFFLNKEDIKLIEEKLCRKFAIREFIDEVVNYIAINIQAKIPSNSYLKTDIYLLLFYSDDSIITEEEVLKIENDKFCCRKIFMKYISPSDNNIIEQFKRKFSFGSLLSEFKEAGKEVEEENIVKDIIKDKEAQLFELQSFTFLDLKKKLQDLYSKYGIEE